MKNSLNLSSNFSLIKPDGIIYADKIVGKYADFGLKVLDGKPFRATEGQVRRHFKIDDVEHTIKMGKLFCNNFTLANFSNEKIAEIIGFYSSEPSTHDELYQKAGEVLFEINRAYFLSGRLIPLIIFGDGDVISATRKITGATNPVEAEEGTIRHAFSRCDMFKANLKLQSAQNVIHTSGSAGERDEELEIWWPGHPVC